MRNAISQRHIAAVSAVAALLATPFSPVMADTDKATGPQTMECVEIVAQAFLGPDPDCNIASSHHRMEQYPEAIEAYEKFARTYGGEDPVRATGALAAIGDAYEAQGDHAKALEYYDKALAMHGADFLLPGIYLSAARSALALGDTAQAQHLADRLFDFNAAAPEMSQMRELLAQHGILYTRGF